MNYQAISRNLAHLQELTDKRNDWTPEEASTALRLWHELQDEEMPAYCDAAYELERLVHILNQFLPNEFVDLEMY